MTMPADPVEDLWSSVLGLLSEDDRITPQLHGFLNLVEPKGVLAGTLYLEVPNDLTRGMLEQRIRIPITEAVSRVGDDSVANFAITVNPDMASEPRVDTVVPSHVPEYAEPVQQPVEQSAAPPVHRGAVRPEPDRRPGNQRSPGVAAQPEVQLRQLRHRLLEPLRARRSGRGRRGPREGVQPALHLRRLRPRQDAPAARDRPLRREPLPRDPGAVRVERGVHERLHQLDREQPLEQFQQRYRDIDILLIDDIQFLQGKDSTQEASSTRSTRCTTTTSRSSSRRTSRRST